MAAYAAGDGDDAIICRRFLSCRFSVIFLISTDRSVTIEAPLPEVNKSLRHLQHGARASGQARHRMVRSVFEEVTVST
jgi:hypothetical protein